MKRSTILSAIAVFAIWAGSALNGIAEEAHGIRITVTGATGTITHLNYDSEGELEGFLVNTNILLSFPTDICGGLGALGIVGNSVTYGGTASTAPSGFQSVRITSFTNNTTKATYVIATSNSTAYGPTSGAVKQLNYTDSGSIDGFLFTPSGSSSLIFISTGERASTTLAPLLTVGATVSVTGTTSAKLSACSSNGTLEAVDASSLTIGGQTIVIAGGHKGGDR